VQPEIGNMELFWQEPAYARFLERLASFSRLILSGVPGEWRLFAAEG